MTGKFIHVTINVTKEVRMFRNKHNPNLKNIKLESSEDAIKRGVKVQTTFFSESEIKKKSLDENESKQDLSNTVDAYDADTYRQLQILKSMRFK